MMKLESTNRADMVLIDRTFAKYDEGYMFNPRFKMGFWDGKKHFLKNGFLPLGLYESLLSTCMENKIEYRTVGFEDFTLNEIDKDALESRINEKYLNDKYTIRDYQLNAVYEALRNKRGILQCCTSSGKSLMIYSIIRELLPVKKKILVIVPSIMLVGQMYSDFVDYGWEEIEKYCERQGGDYQTDWRSQVLISTWQSLQNQQKEIFYEYDAVIVDECHSVKDSNVVTDILGCCINADFKIGTSGTLGDAPIVKMASEGTLGKVLYTVSSKELIDRNILTDIRVATVFLKYPLNFIMQNKGRAYPEEVKQIEEYGDRHKILNFIFSAIKPTDNTLILCNHIAHIKETADYIKSLGKNVKVITGAVKAKDREEIRKSMEDEEGTVLVATYATLSTGVNIKKLHNLVMYGNSKSKIKVLQSIGRVLRKHYSKDKCIVWDLVDDLSYKVNKKTFKNHLLKHYAERKKQYELQEFPIVSTDFTL